MIVDLPSTTTNKVNKRLVEVRESGGAVTLGRVLTLVVSTADGEATEEAIEAANEASREHPCRVIVVARGAREAVSRLDAQIRVGGDAGASEVVVLRLYGPLADHGDSVVVPFLLPDTPVVAWWPGDAPVVPSQDVLGRLAIRRITDARHSADPRQVLATRLAGYSAGDTDLSWTRITHWRALLASTLDQPPHEPIVSATVTGSAESPSIELLAGWLASALRVPVQRLIGSPRVQLQRASGPLTLSLPLAGPAVLSRPGQPDSRVALARREIRDCLAEELRRLDPDEIYENALRGVADVRQHTELQPVPAPSE